MFGLKIFVRVQTFGRGPPVLPCNFCHPDDDDGDSDVHDYANVDEDDDGVVLKMVIMVVVVVMTK